MCQHDWAVIWQLSLDTGTSYLACVYAVQSTGMSGPLKPG